MLRFHLGRIPIDVHFSHVLISLLLGLSFGQEVGSPGVWPGTILSQPAHPQYLVTSVFCVALWMVLVTGSVLVHEMGHALGAQAFGYQSTIHLVGLGGLTQTHHAEKMPWHHDVLFTLAGPAAGLGLGIVAGLIDVALKAAGALPDVAHYILRGLLSVNLFWAVLNLVPISSLDGGRIATAILMRVFGRPGFLAAQIFSLLLGGFAAVLAVMTSQTWMALVLALLLFRTVANIAAYQRGELPAGATAHPLRSVLERAEDLLNQGQFEMAKALALDALRGDAPKGLASRAQLVLGWAALKQGNGREALEAFSRADGSLVRPEALAAAHSLVGDEAQALPLWAQAARETPTEIIVHEFAGALIRAGRESEARRLPGVRPAMAYIAAERVLAVRKEFAGAAQMAEAAFREEPSATLAYDAACDWALAQQPEAALRMLALAAQNGFSDRAHAQTDADLASLRTHPDFIAWLANLPA